MAEDKARIAAEEIAAARAAVAIHRHGIASSCGPSATIDRAILEDIQGKVLSAIQEVTAGKDEVIAETKEAIEDPQ